MALTIFLLVSLFTMLLSAAGVINLPAGSLACTLVPITGANCRGGSAGIAELYVIPYDDIDHTAGITWDADSNASAIPLVATKTWTKYTFERDTAFFNQEKQAVGPSNLNFVQTISINFANNDNATRGALEALDGCCDLVAFVVDNQGKHRLAGILPVAAGGSASRSLGLKTGAGSYNTGADPSSDQHIRTVTLVCNSSKEAPYTDVAVSTLALT